jgi:hypothetical protein
LVILDDQQGSFSAYFFFRRIGGFSHRIHVAHQHIRLRVSYLAQAINDTAINCDCMVSVSSRRES